MIKSENGLVNINANSRAEILMELSNAIDAIGEFLLDNGSSKEDAEQLISKACIVACNTMGKSTERKTQIFNNYAKDLIEYSLMNPTDISDDEDEVDEMLKEIAKDLAKVIAEAIEKKEK